ncbi:hypothetical protein BGZ65_003452 [Modicella reniformis]|uniref:WD40 repeat-like protein n=1 Tax=Modicella reniformis TaxID=1440133 RepID=A0A9P6MLF8_9FUNG|nr:hypothetical protein BGZ65_003452 [Modicella reniformis]
MFGNLWSSKGSLTAQRAYELANVYRENARKTQDQELAVVLCDNADIALGRMKKADKKILLNPPLREEESKRKLRENIAELYLEIGKLLDSQDPDKALINYKNCEKWGGPVYDPTTKTTTDGAQLALTSPHGDGPISLAGLIPNKKNQKNLDIAVVPRDIFSENTRPPAAPQKLPEPDERLASAPQLAYVLSLMKFVQTPDEVIDPVALAWVKGVKDDIDEQDRLKVLAVGLVKAFTRDELKDSKAVSEVVYLAPALEKAEFQFMIRLFHGGIAQSGLLNHEMLEGLAMLMQYAGPDYLEADDLVKILQLLSTRLIETHQQSTDHIYRLTLAVSNVLDAMADARVKGLDRKTLHEPLGGYLDTMRGSDDPYLVYHAAYAFQALQHVPDNESRWKGVMRRTGKVASGVAGLVSAVKSLDLNAFVDNLSNIQEGLAGVATVVETIKSAYDVQDGQLATFKDLVCQAPCRRDPAFQWGVCQRLGEIAANVSWDPEVRRGAISFLVQIYKDDVKWGQKAQIKQWILDILMQLRISSGNILQQFVETKLEDLEKEGDATKQAMYRASQEQGPSKYPLKIPQPEIASPSLLDRVQNKPDTEGSLRLLKKRRLKERSDIVYIPPQGKENPQDRDDTMFPLMDKMDKFVDKDGEQTVFLLMGDSGAGKSTFNRELEFKLWQNYKKEEGIIPLYINLPAIDKPEHDMIAKQLRKFEFTEPEIRELKYNRRFILICDGYDESQQTQNLYTANKLNQQSEWKAKMVISCRSEYLGRDYRDRFQPTDRNRQQSGAELFQQAVIAPFTLDQVQEYIIQFVDKGVDKSSQQVWTAKDYQEALNLIPSLKELVKNPFLLTLSLDVLPRMVDPGQHLSTAKITRVALYDQFVEQWLERNKKRLGEKDLSPQAKAAFEGLTDEGFAQNGIDFLKRLAVDIYKHQGGQPVVEYSRFKDEGSWKDYFFCRSDEKKILREACPLTRSGNQHRFVHRSLLEYSLSRAVFEPQEKRKKLVQASAANRRGSVSSILSFEIQGGTAQPPEGSAAAAAAGILVSGVEQQQQAADFKSPLIWRSFVGEYSVMQFLSERVQQEPIFKQQLLTFIENSKTDQKWRTAAANAITILVRAGVQFNEADLKGIRIPGADLSHGVFDSAEFQGADLRKVKLRNIWLRHANLEKATMAGSHFSEFPFLLEKSAVLSCNYAPDTKRCVVGLASGLISVYSTVKWERVLALTDHTDQVVKVVYSPNGKLIASGSRDKTVRLWDAVKGTCLHVLTDFDSENGLIVFSPQEGQIAIGCDDKEGKTVKVWDEETKDWIQTLKGHTEGISSLSFSSKGQWIITGSSDNTARLWEVATGKNLHILQDESSIRSVAYSPKDNQVATASLDKTVRLWDVETGKCLRTLSGHLGEVSIVVYSPTGDRIATTSDDVNDPVVRLWVPETGVCLHELKGHTKEIKGLAYSPKNNQLASGSADRTVRLWDAETGLCDRAMSGHSDAVTTIVYGPLGDQIASGSLDKTVRLWDIEKSTGRHTSSGHSEPVTEVVLSSGVEQIASISQDKTVRLWDRDTGSCRLTLNDPGHPIVCVTYSPAALQIATGGEDKTVRLWNAENGASIKCLEEHTDTVTSVAFSPSGELIASGSLDKTVRIWDVATGACRFTLSDHTGGVGSILFSAKGHQIVSASYDEADPSLRVWNVEDGTLVHTLTGHTGSLQGMVYSPKGDQLATCSSDKTVRLWDVEAGTCQQTFSDHTDIVSKAVYSPKGDVLATVSHDGTVRLWAMETGTCRQVLSDHTDKVTALVFSPKGDQMITGSHDQTVRLWDVASGQSLAVLDSFKGAVGTVDWKASPEEHSVVTGCVDGSVRAWKVVQVGEEWHVKLVWRTTRDELNVTDASIQDTKGLNRLNSQLLTQRGGAGDPVPPMTFKEAGRKLGAMALASSRLRMLKKYGEQQQQQEQEQQQQQQQQEAGTPVA